MTKTELALHARTQVLGLLKGGAYLSDLEFVFKTHSKKHLDWKQSIDRLVRASLIEREGKNFYRTFNFFCDFAERDVLRKLKPHVAESLEMCVAERMRIVVKKMFQTYGIASDTDELESIESSLPAVEKNVWACLRRMERRLERKIPSSLPSSTSNKVKSQYRVEENLVKIVSKCVSKWKKIRDSMVNDICRILILMLGMESSLTTSEFVRRTDLTFRMRRIQWNKLKRWRIRLVVVFECCYHSLSRQSLSNTKRSRISPRSNTGTCLTS